MGTFPIDKSDPAYLTRVALDDHRFLAFAYGDHRERHVQPLALLKHSNRWGVFAYDFGEGTTKWFYFDRMTGFELTDSRYETERNWEQIAHHILYAPMSVLAAMRNAPRTDTDGER